MNQKGLDEIIAALTDDQRCIYRALIVLGDLKDEISQSITRTNSPENNIDFLPGSVGIQIEPIKTSELGSEVSNFAGWLGVSISGPGYLYPWTFSEVQSYGINASDPATHEFLPRAMARRGCGKTL